MKRRLIGLLLAWTCLGVQAEEQMVQLDIGRAEARLPLHVMTQPEATATLILLPGGDAGSGKIVDGQPSSKNFLTRSRALFFAQQFNVIVVFRPSDLQSLDYDYRISPAHMQELAAVVRHARQLSPAPVWLVGTSRGTVSGTAATLALPEGSVQGLVLTSSVTSKKPGAIATQKISHIKVPTLVVHHQNDACKVCVPKEAARITEGLKSAPVKKFLMISGGADPIGDPCQAEHWHGFINHEPETVQMISAWIKSPSH
jgi:pimeloyl-ACP methyl ester carboxylesterase